MVDIITYFLIICVFIELILIFVIRYLLSEIPWIISDRDEYPEFKKKKIKSFLRKTFDINLGWNWKPKSKHQEKIFSKTNKIFFGNFGERKGTEIKKSKKIDHFASFGDSFVFCRYVKNNETWQEQMTKKTSIHGLNLGVGNFGLDQIYLKYLNTKLPKNIKTIFIGFVPETLSRCLCSWKHYHEFNNIYGFKPKFINHKNGLKLISNPIKNENSFKNIKEIINKIKKNEFFYKEKFVNYKFNFPYTLSLLNNPKYNFQLIFYSILKILNLNKNKVHELVIRENCFKNDIYFRSKKKNSLIKKIMIEIKKKSLERGEKVIYLVFPQKHDMSLKKKNYHDFFVTNKKKFNIIDFTEIFEKKNLDDIYLPDQYGGHLTPYGNKIVAETILKKGYIS
jgi:hypothetical protein